MLHTETSGSGPRVVFIHGFTQTGRSWKPVTAALSDEYETMAVDAPGHGHSAHADADLRIGADLVAEVGGRAVYVGYSMGGRLALHVALRHPELVRGLVLIGATPGIEDDAERAERRRADDELAATIESDGLDAFLERWLANPLFAGLSADRAGVNDRLRNTAAGLAASLRNAGTGSQEPLWRHIAQLAMPVLVLAGEHDPKFRDIGLRMAAAIGTNAKFDTVPGAGHPAHLEVPRAVAAMIRGFLATM